MEKRKEVTIIMDLITVRELYKHPDQYMDQEITIGGWVRSLRDSKSFGFIVISDGTYFELCRPFITTRWRTFSRYPGWV